MNENSEILTRKVLIEKGHMRVTIMCCHLEWYKDMVGMTIIVRPCLKEDKDSLSSMRNYTMNEMYIVVAKSFCNNWAILKKDCEKIK